jgi:hypothetical protein
MSDMWKSVLGSESTQVALLSLCELHQQDKPCTWLTVGAQRLIVT